MSISDVAVGDGLPALVKPPITPEQLQRYANASGDFNPIHLDEAAARRVGLESVIAHGMLSMAFLGQFISQQIADIPDASIANLQVRFSSMVRLGDTITCQGKVQERKADADGHQRVTIECWAQNQRGDKVTTGEATVVLPRR